MLTFRWTLSIILCSLELAWCLDRKNPYFSDLAHRLLTRLSLYKGYKVNWDNDECAGPLEVPSHPRRASISKKKGEPPIANRFALLGMEDGEDEDEDENEDDTSPDT